MQPGFAAGTLSGANQAVQERGPTVNERIWNHVRHLNDICERAEVVLNRIAPRPPTPTSVPGVGSGISTLNRDNNVPPPMLEVVSQLELVCQRVRNIQLELEHIA